MSEGEKAKTITEELHKIAEEMFDKYCKYPLLYDAGDEERLFSERCDKCPLMQL